MADCRDLLNVVGGPPCQEPTARAKGDSIPKSAPLCWWRLLSPTQSVETPTNPAPRHRRTSADYAWTVLQRILSVAKDRGKIKTNPCERGGRLYEADRSDKLWTDDI